MEYQSKCEESKFMLLCLLCLFFSQSFWLESKKKKQKRVFEFFRIGIRTKADRKQQRRANKMWQKSWKLDAG